VTPEERAYYVSHSALSDPGARARLFDALPSDPPRLVAAVGGLILHRGFVASLGITPHPGSGDDVESRTMRKILDRVLARDGAPLDVARPPERRFIGICRDYTLLACAVLRHHGVPARARVGFANYFTPSFNEDHWICEYYAADRWRLLDPELSERVRSHFNVTFDPTDVPRDAFLVAGDAWLRMRRGALAAATCGVSAIGIAGVRFIASNVLRDLAALNKREMLAWDTWGIVHEMRHDAAPPRGVVERIDALAALIAPAKLDWTVVRETYERDDALRVPRVVMSFPRGVPTEVDVSSVA
jgi:hypothetical protein